MPAKNLLLIIALCFAPFQHILPCGNDYYRSEMPMFKNGLEISSLISDDSPYWQRGFDQEGLMVRQAEFVRKIRSAGIVTKSDYQLTWNEMSQLLGKNFDYKWLSDFAWIELRIGDRKNAVKLLEALYAKHPTEYNILANLGTAYEITGNNQKALEFLRKAVAVNPASHYGSEWIHIKILEQKVAATPDYTKILSLGADNDIKNWLRGKGYKNSLAPDSLMIQLAYQLHERISFVAPPDPIVSQLVKDFGDLVAYKEGEKKAQQFYDYAVRYDSALGLKLEQRKNPPVNKPNDSIKNKKNVPALYIVGGVLIAGLLIYLVAGKRSNKAMK